MKISEVKDYLEELATNLGIFREVLLVTKVFLDGNGILRSYIIITDDISEISGDNSVTVQHFESSLKIKAYESFGVMAILDTISNGIRDNGTKKIFQDAQIRFNDDEFIVLQNNGTQTSFRYDANINYYIEYVPLRLGYTGNNTYGTVNICTA